MPKKPNETIPGGAYINGGQIRDDGIHYGGEVIDAEGKVLRRFGDDEPNTGLPKWAESKESGPPDDWRNTSIDKVKGLDAATMNSVKAAGIGTAGELADRLDRIDKEPIAGLAEPKLTAAKKAVATLRD